MNNLLVPLGTRIRQDSNGHVNVFHTAFTIKNLNCPREGVAQVSLVNPYQLLLEVAPLFDAKYVALAVRMWLEVQDPERIKAMPTPHGPFVVGIDPAMPGEDQTVYMVQQMAKDLAPKPKYPWDMVGHLRFEPPFPELIEEMRKMWLKAPLLVEKPKAAAPENKWYGLFKSNGYEVLANEASPRCLQIWLEYSAATNALSADERRGLLAALAEDLRKKHDWFLVTSGNDFACVVSFPGTLAVAKVGCLVVGLQKTKSPLSCLKPSAVGAAGSQCGGPKASPPDELDFREGGAAAGTTNAVGSAGLGQLDRAGEKVPSPVETISIATRKLTRGLVAVSEAHKLVVVHDLEKIPLSIQYELRVSHPYAVQIQQDHLFVLEGKTLAHCYHLARKVGELYRKAPGIGGGFHWWAEPNQQATNPQLKDALRDRLTVPLHSTVGPVRFNSITQFYRDAPAAPTAPPVARREVLVSATRLPQTLGEPWEYSLVFQVIEGPALGKDLLKRAFFTLGSRIWLDEARVPGVPYHAYATSFTGDGQKFLLSVKSECEDLAAVVAGVKAELVRYLPRQSRKIDQFTFVGELKTL